MALQTETGIGMAVCTSRNAKSVSVDTLRNHAANKIEILALRQKLAFGWQSERLEMQNQCLWTPNSMQRTTMLNVVSHALI